MILHKFDQEKSQYVNGECNKQEVHPVSCIVNFHLYVFTHSQKTLIRNLGINLTSCFKYTFTIHVFYNDLIVSLLGVDDGFEDGDVVEGDFDGLLEGIEVDGLTLGTLPERNNDIDWIVKYD